MIVRISRRRQWPATGSSFAILVLVAVMVSFAEAFITQPLSLQQFSMHFQEGKLPKTCLSESKAQHKHSSSGDRYSSSTVAESHVASHFSSLYAENNLCYRKNLKKIKREEEERSIGGESVSHNKLLNELNRYPSLILNADYQPMSYLPLSVSHWQEAIKLIFSGKVSVVDVYEGVSIRAANLDVPLPAVIALNEYVPQCNHKPAFTRRNVFLRDEYTCQYCNKPHFTKDLSIDHVHPRSMGGRLTWDNAVTSCLNCNGRKGNRLPSELKSVGMKLHNKPRAPTRHELALKAGKMLPRKLHPTWQPYLAAVYDHGADDDDSMLPSADLEALGIPNLEPQGSTEEPSPATTTKVVSKNKKKKMKRNQKKLQEVQR